MNTQPHVLQPASVLADFVSLRFLPSLFGHDYVQAENNVYLYASRYLANYDGTVWDFVPLPGGGGYMKPEGNALWHFSNTINHNTLDVNAEVAGVIITALVLNHRSWMYDRHDEEELCAHYCKRYRQLMNYIDKHPDADTIFQAIK